MRIIFTFITALFLFAGVASANDESYIVRNVQVDAVGKNSTKAREAALAQGQEQAFYRVIERLSPRANLRNSIANIPELAAEEKNNTISNMVRALDVNNESVTGTRYLATLDIHFQPEYIKDFLRQNNLTVTEQANTTMLVIPVLFDETSQPRLNFSNPWANAWQTLINQQRFESIQLILPQQNDPLLTQLNPTQMLANHYNANEDQALNSLRHKYRASHVVFTAARTDNSSQQTLVTMARIFGEEQPTNLTENADLSAQPLAETMNQTAYSLAARLQGQQALLKNNSLSSSQKIDVRIPLSSHQDWMNIQRKLDAIGFISTWDLKELSSRSADVNLSLSSTPASLSEAFASEGFSLEQYDGTLVLNTTTPANRPSLFNFFPR